MPARSGSSRGEINADFPDLLERHSETSLGNRIFVGDLERADSVTRRYDAVERKAGLSGRGVTGEHRHELLGCAIAHRKERRAPASAHPFLATGDDNIGKGERGVDHTEALHRVDDEDAVTDDLADAFEVR